MRATLLLLVGATIAAACAPAHQPSSPEPVSSDPRLVLHRPSPFVLCEGQSLFATVIVSWDSNDPIPSTNPPDIRWTSADTSIATLNAYDEINARKAGRTYVVATTNWGALTATTRFSLQVLKGDMDGAATRRTGRLVCGRPLAVPHWS